MNKKPTLKFLLKSLTHSPTSSDKDIPSTPQLMIQTLKTYVDKICQTECSTEEIAQIQQIGLTLAQLSTSTQETTSNTTNSDNHIIANQSTSTQKTTSNTTQPEEEKSPKSNIIRYSHRFDGKNYQQAKGIESLAHNHTIEESEAFADEVERLCNLGVNRRTAYSKAKSNLLNME